MATINENLQALNEIKQNIKTAIENKGQNLTDVPFSQYAEKISAIETGDTSGESYYDVFWDLYQNNGKRANYKHAFANVGWTNATFKPKYDIIINSNSYNIFDGSKIEGSLPEILKNLGVKLEFNDISYQAGGFNGTLFTEIDFVLKDCSPTLAQVFGYSPNLHTLKIGTINKNVKFNSTFLSLPNTLPALKNLTIVGEIGQNGFNVSTCPVLSKESIKNIVGCLSTTTNNLSVTFSLIAVNKAFETSEGANDGSTSSEWLTLIGTKSNWTITLS